MVEDMFQFWGPLSKAYGQHNMEFPVPRKTIHNFHGKLSYSRGTARRSILDEVL